jgi:hypothetical protein
MRGPLVIGAMCVASNGQGPDRAVRTIASRVRVDGTAIPAAGGQVWAYPNLHGDVILTTDATGLRQGVRSSHDPFGQPIAPNGDIGTQAADDSIPGTSPGDADYGYVGQHDKLYGNQLGDVVAVSLLMAMIPGGGLVWRRCSHW